MRTWFYKFHCHLWFRLQMMEAYLAYHRGEYILAAELENDARRYESELRRLNVLSRVAS